MMSIETFQTEELRVLPLTGLYNVRDLGGYPAGSRRVKWGRLYRAGDLADLSSQAREYLEARRLKTIVDFRDTQERNNAPDGYIATVEQNYALPIRAGNIMDMPDINATGKELMGFLYSALVDECYPQYRRFFSILADPGNSPIIFHCAAGKDRTGVGAALVLSALGVDRETIIQDYLLSAECIRGKYDAWVAAKPETEPLTTVHPEYLEAAFDRIDQKFGGMDRYLRENLEVDPELLRALYTE
jgi:protein-tyrosine phosphatase